jgi:hypothetical protein
MLKRTTTLLAAGAILMSGALATLTTGCDDSPASPATTSSLSTDDATAGVAKSSPQLMGDEAPTGAGIFAPKPYERWLRELRMTDAQAASARRCLESYRRCLRDAEITYIHTKNELRQQKERSAREIRQAVEAGRITADQGRERLRQLEERIARALRENEAAAKSNVANCERAFQRCIREFLTREQIARWERLSSGGTHR